MDFFPSCIPAFLMVLCGGNVRTVRVPIPVALIGAGKHGGRYLRHVLEDVPGLRVTVLCRRDAEAGRRQAESVRARYVSDFREAAVAADAEAVIAVVPPWLHGEIVRLAAGAGKALLLEKPLATSVAIGREIRAAVAASGVPFLIAQTLRGNGVVRRLRQEVPALGRIDQLSLSQRFEPSPLDWLDDPARSGGGIILHTGIHSFDLVRFLTGRDPRWAFAATARVATRRTEDNFAALFGFGEPGFVAAVAGSRSTAGRNGTIEISGERGQLFGDHVHGIAVRIEGTRRIDLGRVADVPTVREMLRAFEALVARGEVPPATLDDGLWAVAMAEACARSAERGAPVPVET